MKINQFCILNYTPLLCRIKFIFIFFLIIFNHINFSNCTTVTLGIDWGEEYVEASIAFRGHRPDILLTGTGSRKFENAVYLLGDTRLFDKEASSFALKDPSKTLQKSAHLLGIPFSSSSKWTRMSSLKASDVVETFKKNNVSFHWDYTPYEFGVSKDGQLHLKVLKDSMVGLEEATGHFFNHIKNVALEKLVSVKAIESHDSQVEMMAVISIPCNYTQNQRRALVFAAESAGLKVVDLVHGITAAAWLNTLEMAPGTKKILYYDLGSSGANVGVVEARVPSPKSSDIPQIKTLSCVTYPGIGGRQHDLLLAEYLRDKFEADHNVKLMPGNPRSLQKLLKNVNKAKMKLSVSETASVEIDNLVKNKHLNFKVTRPVYDKLLDPVLQKLQEPLNMALNQANLKLSDLDSIEMLGGAWRVPSVTTKLSESVKPLQLGFHLNAEESIAMGCGYLAAAHNPFFRMKKIELYDNAVFEYILHVKGTDLDKKVTLYKPGDKINHPKVVKVNTTNNFNLSIYETYNAVYNTGTKDGTQGNRGLNSDFGGGSDLANVKVLDYKVTGVDDMLMTQKSDRTAQVSLKFKTENGVIRLIKVTAKPIKKYGAKKLNKTKFDLTTSEHTFSDIDDLKNKESSAGSEVDDSVTADTQEADAPSETSSTTSEVDGLDDNEALLEYDSGVGSTESLDKLGDQKADDAEKEAPETRPDGEGDHSETRSDTEKESSDSAVEPDKKQDGSSDSAKHTANKDSGKVSPEKASSPGEEKSTKESLKDKLLNKLSEDQVDLHFVDNTPDLYHINKLKESKKNIETLVSRDKAAIERSHSKNKLESMLYKYKAVLKSEDFKAACKPNEGHMLSEKVKTLLEWFDEHSYKATLETFKKHLDDLSELGGPIYRRMDDNVNRESLIKSTDADFEDLQEKLAQLITEKPYLGDNTTTLDMFRANVTWWEQIKSEQATRPAFEDGLFDASTVKSKLDLNRMLLKNLQQTKPPTDETKDESATAEGTAASDDTTTSDQPEDGASDAKPDTGTDEAAKSADPESADKTGGREPESEVSYKDSVDPSLSKEGEPEHSEL